MKQSKRWKKVFKHCTNNNKKKVKTILFIVGEHINEMQRVHDEYGAIFEHLARNHSRTSTQLTNNGSSGMITNCLIDLSPTALIHVSIHIIPLSKLFSVSKLIALQF